MNLRSISPSRQKARIGNNLFREQKGFTACGESVRPAAPFDAARTLSPRSETRAPKRSSEVSFCSRATADIAASDTRRVSKLSDRRSCIDGARKSCTA
eukprot:2046721-Pleurochrysis_carterae.AAC.1